MTKVQDPVCKMMIETSQAAAHGTYEGVEVYFCRRACQEKYERTHPRSRGSAGL